MMSRSSRDPVSPVWCAGSSWYAGWRLPEGVRGRAQRGFTLTEMLVVIGIIAVLVGILIPVVGRVRQSAEVANTQALIVSMSNAIQNYYTDFSAYPGVFSNRDVIGGGISLPVVGGGLISGVSMSENLTLSLLGGLVRTSGPGVTPVSVQYDPKQVGLGAASLSPYMPKQSPKYLDVKPRDLSTEDMGLSSVIPEILDRTAHRRPILYLRAQVGADGAAIASSGSPAGAQYDIAQYVAYLKSTDGLQASGLDNTIDFGNAPYKPLPYFRNPAMGGTNNATSTARQKDGYILISAGADGIYGTNDDITNFGAVRP